MTTKFELFESVSVYEFKGELRIEKNNQLILDTIEVDAKKYNL